MISRQYRMSPGPQRRSGGLLPIILAILFILVINSVLSGGGFNCRHVWMEVSGISELQDLAGTGESISEAA